jgi:hypothetical protein
MKINLVRWNIKRLFSMVYFVLLSITTLKAMDEAQHQQEKLKQAKQINAHISKMRDILRLSHDPNNLRRELLAFNSIPPTENWGPKNAWGAHQDELEALAQVAVTGTKTRYKINIEGCMTSSPIQAAAAEYTYALMNQTLILKNHIN